MSIIYQHTYTCSKYKMEIFPCSCGILVCQHITNDLISIVSNMYTTMTYRWQYHHVFTSLSNDDYWIKLNCLMETLLRFKHWYQFVMQIHTNTHTQTRFLSYGENIWNTIHEFSHPFWIFHVHFSLWFLTLKWKW